MIIFLLLFVNFFIITVIYTLEVFYAYLYIIWQVIKYLKCLQLNVCYRVCYRVYYHILYE